MHSLTELIAFNSREKAREMPYFGQELLLSAEKKGPLTTPAYRAALTKCRALARAQGIDLVMQQSGSTRSSRQPVGRRGPRTS